MISGRTVRILSIDGGGIRGLIPALILEKIEKELAVHGQRKPFARVFDLIAGTSTGGILAVGLTVPEPESESDPSITGSPMWRKPARPKFDTARLADIYRIDGQRIFPGSGLNKFRNFKQAFAQKYDTEPFELVIRESLGNATLRDTVCPILVTAYDATRLRIQLFRTSKARTKQIENFYLRDVLRATSAAPSYFEPALVSPVGMENTLFTMVDGALFANNPALLAYQEAQRIFPFARKFIVVSLGTGKQVDPHPHEEMRGWGFLDWLNPLHGLPLLSMMAAAQSQSVEYTLKHTPGVEYIRIDDPLSGCSHGIDDASPKNIACLEAFAHTVIERNEEKIDRIIRLLRRA